MHAHLKQHPDINLGRLSYTTTARRIHHQHRVMLTGCSIEDLRAQVEVALHEHTGATRPKGNTKVVFTFTGQGAQYLGMGRELFEKLGFFRTEMLHLDRLAQKMGFESILPIITYVGDERDLNEFSVVSIQLASVCLQIALAKLWASWGVTPTAVIGHSLGEYAALQVSGVLSDADAIYLVGKRATLLQEKCTRDTHSMLVVKASVDEMAAALVKHSTSPSHIPPYEVACINSPTETVVTGINQDIGLIKDVLARAALRTTLLKVPYAFHSSQVDSILDEYETVVGHVQFRNPKIPVVCPLDGTVIESGDNIGAHLKLGPKYFAQQTRQTVNMMQALLTAQTHGILPDKGIALEIGPHPAVSGMVKAVVGSSVTCLPSLQRGRPAFQTLTSALKMLFVAGAEIRWPAYHSDFESSQKLIPMPDYSWDLAPYWIQYVNDWSLRKGEEAPLLLPNINGQSRRLESTTIHRIVEETGDSMKACVMIESDVGRQDFRPLVEGHEVDGVPLCTPAVYADIALSLGRHLLDHFHPRKTTGTCLEVADMTILKALMLSEDLDASQEQMLRVRAEADWSSNSATVKFSTLDVCLCLFSYFPSCPLGAFQTDFVRCSLCEDILVYTCNGTGSRS